MFKNSMQVVDNVLPDFLFERFHRKALSKEIFQFNPNMDGNPDEYGFASEISTFDGVRHPDMFEDCMNVLQFSCKEAGVIPNKIIQTRLFLQTPFSYEPKTRIHTDLYEEHLVCLFYMTDADTPYSDTKIYNHDMSFLGEVSPKKNRAVIFDGMLPHSSGFPKEGYRLVCNINFSRKGV